ncbi:MAG: methyltransferase domain-containing protein [Pseudomonadales bacterium]|nr:methyltransferase domain-containing protein [Pseudomonadales bacterium]
MAAKKTTKITSRANQRTAFGVKILNSSHQDIRRLKRAGNIATLHGNKFWNSSFLIMDYLRKNPLKENLRVLEIGCGWGLLGIYCAKKYNADVTGIDADSNVLPFMTLHAEINKVAIEAKKMSFQQLTVNSLKKFDLIIGADICYWDEMTQILNLLIGRAKRAGVDQIIIADPCRQPFTDLVTKTKKKYPGVKLITKRLKKPVAAAGEILLINCQQSAD